MKRRGYWQRILLANVAAAITIVFVFSGATLATPAGALVRAFAVAFVFSMCTGPLLGLAMPRVAPWIWTHLRFPLNWAAIATVMAALAMAGSVVAIAVLVGVGYVPARQFGPYFAGSLRIAIAITLTIGLFMTAYESLRARLAQANAEAQLASLESRVQPHFLFNTLNSIAALFHEDPHGAERMTGQLASLLRASLDQQAAPLVALNDELQTVRDYLSIEQVRFGERLRVDLRIDPASATARVPRLALQTIVENSVKHVASARRTGASITITSQVEAGGALRRPDVRIVVEDAGDGFDPQALPPGHGLALLRDRMALLLANRGTLRIDSGPAGTAVTLVVPAGGETA
jgi:hypothetical protein